ncbi:MAG: hypothetical protein ACOYBJ_03555 [Patescibacteria group bacterium]|jgi:glycerol-3-phosphate dehydrogenase (NAD(P)+)
MEKLLILGAGKIGSALASVLRDANQPFAQWDVDPSLVPNQVLLSELALGAETVILCVPTTGIQNAAASLAPYLQPGALVLAVSKGIVSETTQCIDEFLATVFPAQQIGLLYGPMLAEELLRGKIGAATVATVGRAAYDRFAPVFAESRLILEYSDDVRGVAVLGALKNIYAVGLGIATGVELGGNASGWLIGQALREIPELLVALGGKPETLLSSAGAADLITTALSPASKNHQFGVALATGVEQGFAEGAAAYQPLVTRLHGNHDLPFFQAIGACLAEGADSRAVFTQLFQQHV